MKSLSIKFILATALLLAAFVVSTPVTAKPAGNFGSQLSAAQCDPSGGKLVLNIVFQVIETIDNGKAGPWALDSFMRHVQAWEMASGVYCVEIKDTGSFVTTAGSSPNGDETVAAGVTGTMEGGARLMITGSLNTDLRLKGKVPGKDCSGATTPCSAYDFLATYFPAATSKTYTFFGWTYRAGTNGTWTDSWDGTGAEIFTGDITGTP